MTFFSRFPRRAWIWIALAIVITVPFWIFPLDIAAARAFHRPELADPWPVAQEGWALFFYRSAPALSVVWMVLALSLCVTALARSRHSQLWKAGVFMCLTMAIGPGLVVNGILKDHAGRYRPRQVEELGGTHDYAPPLSFALHEGHSFPCGHCSVGFIFGTLVLVLPRGKRLAKAALFTFSLLLGSALGLGRMAAGAHFFSDVLWAGLIVWGSAWVSYHLVYEVGGEKWQKILAAGKARRRTVAVLAVVAVAFTFSVLAATPFDKKLAGELPATGTGTLVVEVPNLPVRIETAEGIVSSYAGDFRGFGFPNRRITATISSREGAQVLSVRRSGLFTDLEGTVTLLIAANGPSKIVLCGDPEAKAGVMTLAGRKVEIATQSGR